MVSENWLNKVREIGSIDSIAHAIVIDDSKLHNRLHSTNIIMKT